MKAQVSLAAETLETPFRPAIKRITFFANVQVCLGVFVFKCRSHTLQAYSKMGRTKNVYAIISGHSIYMVRLIKPTIDKPSAEIVLMCWSQLKELATSTLE